jgi:membrane protein implicated in regulation of membrane protease activity
MMVAVVMAVVVAVALRRGVRRRCSEPGENEREQDED